MPDPFERDRTAVLAFDPGGKTGWAVEDGGKFVSSEIAGSLESQAAEIAELFFRYQPKVVIYETYTITQRTAQLSQQHEPLMLIGVIRHLAGRAGVPVAAQKPATAKAFSTDIKLKALNWYFNSVGGHANDAARHLMVWAASHGHFDKDTLIKLAEAA